MKARGATLRRARFACSHCYIFDYSSRELKDQRAVYISKQDVRNYVRMWEEVEVVEWVVRTGAGRQECSRRTTTGGLHSEYKICYPAGRPPPQLTKVTRRSGSEPLRSAVGTFDVSSLSIERLVPRLDASQDARIELRF
jgi:hypothetical protein